ncbi:regulator of G-protein signaling 20 isoform X3 [Cavia porcellus]|uniref:regulator of G-protein signaling 20 isoform X3 n=1 Tax=Cavia porcellus TaxID=10141 RepID=UPI002FE2ABD0
MLFLCQVSYFGPRAPRLTAPPRPLALLLASAELGARVSPPPRGLPASRIPYSVVPGEGGVRGPHKRVRHIPSRGHTPDACARPTEASLPERPLRLARGTVGPLTVRNQEQRPTRATHELRINFPPCEESPAPTLEEVSAWARSFDNLMVTPAGRNAFRQFLRTEFSEENMLFWMACEELKKEANKNIIEEKARIIYEDYISILSPKEVSLDSRVREIINRNMGEPSPHIFDDAQLQIYTLMHRDSYPRFMNSAVYKDLLQSLSEKSAEA